MTVGFLDDTSDGQCRERVETAEVEEEQALPREARLRRV